jgi:lipoyl(octanoyl) transferase
VRPIETRWLGRIAYDQAHALQLELLAKRIAGDIDDTLLLLEHEPVVTVGPGRGKGARGTRRRLRRDRSRR